MGQTDQGRAHPVRNQGRIVVLPHLRGTEWMERGGLTTFPAAWPSVTMEPDGSGGPRSVATWRRPTAHRNRAAEKEKRTVNRVLLTGRLTRDPEMRSLASGKAVTQFSVATNEYIGQGKE